MSAKKRLKVLWAAPERLSLPLDTTTEAKFRLLSKHIEPYVLVWSANWKPEVKQIDSAYFYLLPGAKRLHRLLIPVLYPFVLFPFLLYLLIKKRFDVVLIRPGLGGIACASIKRLSVLFRLKFGLLVEAFGDWIEVALASKNKLLQPVCCYWLAAISKLSISSADMLRAESLSTMNKMREFAPDTPFSVFPRVNLELFLDLKVKSEAGDSETFNILYVGELIKFKGVHHLIGAFRNIITDYPKVRLTIVGDGNYRMELEEMADRLDILDLIKFTAYLPPKKVKECMLDSNLLVLPSMTEGLPRVIIEAMAVGLPIIATDVGSVKELVKNGKNGYLIEPNDVDSLTKAILALVGDKEKTSRMGLESKKIIQKTGDLYTMEGYARRYIDTINKVYKIVQGKS